MKKIVLSLLFIAALTAVGHAQIFTQNFNSSSTLGDYVDAGGAANKFTAISGGTNNVVSVVNGALRFTKIGGNSAYFSRGAIAAANFAGPPSVLKISFSFHAVSSTIGGSTQAQMYVGSNFANSATAPTGTNTHSRLVFNFGTNNDFSMNSSTAPTTETTYYTTKQNITWVINNSGAAITYTTPDGVTTKILANDKWDVYVGATSTPVLTDRDGLTNATAGNGKDNLLENIYFGYPSGANSNATIEIDDILINDQTTVLPIALTSFTAKANLQNVDLVWATASEKDNSHFDVLRSSDGKTFIKIDEIKGNGTVATLSNYSMIDRSALPGTSYYKLRQVDYDNKSSLSESIAVKSNIADTHFKVTSSAQDGTVKLTVFAANEGRARFKIYDLSGRKVAEKEVNLSNGYTSETLQLNSGKGLHIASLTTATETITQKFMH